MPNLKLISSHDEAGNVKTFVFENSGLKWRAGQNQAYILPQAGKTEDENQRYFTLSSAPSEGTVNISTRVSQSFFKQSLNALKPGDEIRVFDLGGDFTWEDEPSKQVVMVAGGIGITPFRSILLERDFLGKKINADLLYFNRNNEIPFLKKFKELENNHPEFKMKVMVGQPVTAEKIMELEPKIKEKILYISGPEPMVEKISDDLKKYGINAKQDRFPGYDEKNF